MQLIELYTWGTPNGRKVSVMLEECGLPYNVHKINIGKDEQFAPEYLRLNPNGKIPSIIDPEGPGGKPYSLMESGAILIYLAEKTGKLLPTEPRKRYDTLQWLMFQMAHIGPMFGQANHFNSLKQEGLKYAKDRYNNESVRLYKVLDNRLRESAWLGCDEYTVADMAVYPWTKSHKDRGIDKAGYPNFMRWYETMEARPAVQRNNKMAAEIRERMTKAAEGKQAINLYDTKDNAERLAQGTKR